MNCQFCNSTRVIILESRKKSNGVRRRRYRCEGCLERWTVFEGKAAPPEPKKYRPLSTRQLTEEQAEMIMLSDKTSSVLAKEFGMTRQSIDLVRKGKTYTNIYMRLQQEGHLLRTVGKLSCEACVHWRGQKGCDFEFPDAGGDFATDCYLFRQL